MTKINLQVKITFLFIIILVVSLAGVYFYYLPQVEKNMEIQAYDNLKSVASNSAVFLESLIEEEKSKITVLANNSVIESNNSTPTEKLHELNVFRQQYQTYDEITLLDVQGNVVASTDYNYRGDWKTKTWYQQTLHGNVTVTDAHVILNPWKLVILFLAPITDANDSVTGVVSGQIQMDHYWNILDNITLGETGFVQMINNEGRVIYHKDRSKIFSMIPSDNPLYAANHLEKIPLYYTEEQNKTFLGACVPLVTNVIYDGFGSWYLLAAQEKTEVFSSLSDFKTNLLISSLIFCLFLGVLGYFVSRSIVNPIMKLDEGMKDVAGGNLKYTIDFFSNDELGTLTQSFNKMVKKLAELTQEVEERNKLVEKLLQQKNEFINQLGHDLKNPLGPFLTLIPILIKKESDSKKKKMLTVLDRNAGYMKNLVVNTIELAKLNSSDMQFNFKTLSLNEIVDQIYSDNQLLLNEKNIRLKNNIPNDFKVYADELRLVELFKNIVGNSVKYSDKNGEIRVDAVGENDKVKVIVSDTGIGMTENQLDHVFDEYYKADGSRHDFESSGLGMSICKRIVEKHGGQIWAESEGLGAGSTFYFTLPAPSVCLKKSEERSTEIKSYPEISNRIDQLFLEE